MSRAVDERGDGQQHDGAVLGHGEHQPIARRGHLLQPEHADLELAQELLVSADGRFAAERAAHGLRVFRLSANGEPELLAEVERRRHGEAVEAQAEGDARDAGVGVEVHAAEAADVGADRDRAADRVDGADRDALDGDRVVLDVGVRRRGAGERGGGDEGGGDDRGRAGHHPRW